MAKILVVDDESLMRDMVVEILDRLGHDIKSAKEVKSGLELFDTFEPDLVISDFKMPGLTGMDFLKEIQKRRPGTSFIIMTAYGTIDTAVEMMRLGASDFIEKPFAPDLMEMVVARTLEKSELKAENKSLKLKLASKHSLVGGESDGYKEQIKLIDDVADAGATILVLGESGVGKEILARNIHARSIRSEAPFIKVNCAALPESLIESELFGHEKGAFTGALKTKKGKFESANHGTLLLDEIGEMPLAAQAKLLRVLQEKEVSRLGGDEEIEIDVRVICTTNRDLAQEVKDGNFREDLYYRLNVIPMKIKSLRDRKEDIPNLVLHFIAKYNNEYGYSVEGLEAEAETLLKNYPWPGNIRQLENSVERAMVFAKSGLLDSSKFDLQLNEPNMSSDMGEMVRPGMSVAQAEQILILKTLELTGGNKGKASEMLDISIRTLRNKLHEYGEFNYERERKGEN